MAPFSLWCEVFPAAKQSGGSIPLAPGEIQNLYQPVDTTNLGQSGGSGGGTSEGQFVDPAVYGKRLVKIVMKFNEYTVEKEYMVTDRRVKHIITIINLVNITRAKINVMASNIRRITTNAMVVVKNLHVKYFK